YTTSASHYCKIISNIPLVSNKANSPDRDSTSNPRLVFHVNSKEPFMVSQYPLTSGLFGLHTEQARYMDK
ncbi:MAG: hypothetical protein PHR32_07660, partial [Candidatus Cloacimonetes bacterium]|nr:hypothetical protein [Candidatus Cloacimonadota bacterium]